MNRRLSTRLAALSFSRAATLLMVMGAMVTSGCIDRDLRPLNPCPIRSFQQSVQVENVEKVDLLFMIDNSNSMREEQEALAREIPGLVRALVSGTLGERTFPPVKDLNVGIISSDMGTGGITVTSCSEPNLGDDGVLITRGNTDVAGCMGGGYPTFLNFQNRGGAVDETAVTNFAAQVNCVAQLGVNGCGFEQQLESILKALSPTTRNDFFRGTTGHSGPGGQNEGFIREDALLAVIAVTDEDDCSATDPELFRREAAAYMATPLNLRCAFHPEAVFDVNRYIEGLLQIKDNPSLFVFAGIVGIPTDLVPALGEDPDFNGMLNDDRMQNVQDPGDPTRLRTSCNVPGVGEAFPPRRIVQLAQGLEQQNSNGIIQSICQSSYAGALSVIIDKIADALNSACLPIKLNRNSLGTVSCNVIETLPLEGDFTQCDQVPGRVLREYDDLGREVCTVTQLTVTDGMSGTSAGWFYSEGDDEVCDQRIAYTDGDEPKTGTIVNLECLQEFVPEGTEPDVNVSCDGMESGFCDDGARVPELTRRAFPKGLSCEPNSLTCQPVCDTDADCPGGYACYAAEEGAQQYCVNPTCS